MTNLIEIEGVSHAYQTASGPLPVLDGLTLSVPEGRFCAVVGPSGCGKSTLTRLIAGLMFPDRGEVRLNGEVVRSPRKSVGMAFQNPVLLEWRTILNNVILPLEIVAPRMPRSQREDRARELLALVGLEGFEDKRPSELSGGMRQRASLCRSLVHKPDILILDEPFGALDAFTREDLWQLMHRLRAEEPFTALLITHDLRESVYLADQVVVLSGRPARTQFVLDLDLPGPRPIEMLYTTQSVEWLAQLRAQIEIAQGRSDTGGHAR
ncbi:MAG: ABC transporter ATP-binding protein [Rubellimicrobium sp.]|nr:ABC transporter ATP-binding protein [Rubellimicrobium sp.]